MNNPDERTAVEQFGKGDKYFGVSVLLATMPGLPMLGHGQIEGFAEKYGMEYRRAYWDEPVDEDMVRRHEREIFPLLHRRALFSGSRHFALYDFQRADGSVDENVFAYTNRHGDERALVLYNNTYPATAGRIHTSTPINVGTGDAPRLEQRSLTEALGLRAEEGVFYTFRDVIGGGEYLRHSKELADGFHAELSGYRYQVFVDWRERVDEDRSWTELHARLGGRAVPDLARARREMELEPVLGELERTLREALAAVAPEAPARGTDAESGPETPLAGTPDDTDDAAPLVAEDAAKPAAEETGATDEPRALAFPESAFHAAPAVAPGALAAARVALRAATARLAGRDLPPAGDPVAAPAGLDADLLVERAGHVLAGWAPDADAAAGAWLAARLAGLLAWHPGLLAAHAAGEGGALLRSLREDPVAVAYLGINHHAGHDYLRRETLAQWLGAEALLASEIRDETADDTVAATQGEAAAGAADPDAAAAAAAILEQAERGGFRLADLAAALAHPPSASAGEEG
jgi:hypothetical protein